MLQNAINKTKSWFILPALYPGSEQSCLRENAVKKSPAISKLNVGISALYAWCNPALSAFANFKCTHAALTQHRLYRVLFKKKFADFTDVRVKKKSRFCQVVNGILLQQHLLLHLNWLLIHLSNLCFLSISLLQLSKLIETLNKQVEAKGKEINEYREKYGIRVRGEQAPEQTAEEKKSSSTQGVLVAPSTMESVD